MLQTRPSTWNAITKSTINGQWRTVARPPAKPPRDAYLGKPTGRPRIDACSSRRDRQAPQSHQLRIRYAGEDKEGYPYREERPFRETLEAEATVQGASRSFDQETPGSPFLNLLKQCAARHPRDRCSPRISCSHLRKNTPRSDLGFFFFGFRIRIGWFGEVFKIDARRSTTEEKGGPWSRTTPPPRAAGGAAAVAAGAGRGEAIDMGMP